MYSLRGRDPEGGRVKYTISGDYFSVDGDTGAVRLREPLDREATDAIDVVITIQDAAFNLIPFRREIRGKYMHRVHASLTLHFTYCQSEIKFIRNRIIRNQTSETGELAK